MTPEHAKILLPIITAFSEGEIIQYHTLASDTDWHDISNSSFLNSPERYRVKPKPRVAREWTVSVPTKTNIYHTESKAYGSDADDDLTQWEHVQVREILPETPNEV